MNVIESLKWRYATKKFNSEKQLSEIQINTLKEAFNLTATSYGLQPISLVVIKSKKLQNELISHSWNQQQVGQASHVLVICVPKKFDLEIINSYFKLVKKIRNTPDKILNPFKDFLTSEMAKKTPEELFQWSKNQAYLALGNLLTTCAIEKIDACPMEGFISEKYDEVLGLEKQNLTSVLTLPVGFRADDCFMKDLPKVRKNIEKSVISIY